MTRNVLNNKMYKWENTNMLSQINKNEEKIILKLRELPEEKRVEVIDFIDFLRRSILSPKRKIKGEEYSYYLAELRIKIQNRGGLGLGKSKEEVLEKLRKTREKVWKEDYENHFRH